MPHIVIVMLSIVRNRNEIPHTVKHGDCQRMRLRTGKEGDTSHEFHVSKV
jgi:hypothetical protein